MRSRTLTPTTSRPGGYETYPLSEGDGAYAVSVFENLQGTEYALLFRGEFDVRLNDPFRPFLYPNQFVRFSADDKAIAATQEIAGRGRRRPGRGGADIQLGDLAPFLRL